MGTGPARKVALLARLTGWREAGAWRETWQGRSRTEDEGVRRMKGEGRRMFTADLNPWREGLLERRAPRFKQPVRACVRACACVCFLGMIWAGTCLSWLHLN